MIIILSSKSDIHATTVLSKLEMMGEHAILLDLSDFPIHSKMSINFDNLNEERIIWNAINRSIDFSKVRSVWWRRPQQFQVDPAIKISANIEFALNESHEAVTGLWQTLDAFWVNVPSHDALAHRKAYQLKAARELGIPIPETLISNDVDAAKQFIERYDKVVCKAFSATETHWRETRLVGEEELSSLDNVRFAPVIFQQYIEAQYDLRITIVGNEIFPAAIYSQETAYPVDCRMDIGSARIESVSLPEEVELQLRRFMDKLGLVYGAIDMRLQSDDTYVFLEINPAGQFLFIENATKQPIAESMAKTLATGYS